MRGSGPLGMTPVFQGVRILELPSGIQIWCGSHGCGCLAVYEGLSFSLSVYNSMGDWMPPALFILQDLTKWLRLAMNSTYSPERP